MPTKNGAIPSTRWVPAILLAGIISVLLTAQPGLCAPKSAGTGVFSLDVRKEPLGEVLKKISKDTGYHITVDSEWTGLPVSRIFKDLPMDQGLRRILSDLNYSIVFNEADHRISIDIKSFLDGEVFQKVGLSRAADDNPPGALRSLAVNLKDVINPGEIQVIPPTEPGGAGITLKEMQALEVQRAKISPDDIEVIPPAEVGGKGVSLKDSKAQQSHQKPKLF